MTRPAQGFLSARTWWRACAAALLCIQIFADGAAALPHPGDVWAGPATLESHHSAQCVRVHDAARCAVCQYQATRPLPAQERRIDLTARTGFAINRQGQPQTIDRRPRHRAIPPRAPPQLPL